MSLVNDLISLYDSNSDVAGKIFSDRNGKQYTLFPLYHSSAMADIEVTITSNGTFVTAALIEKENKFTVIPVTEESNSRTANVAPHPLFDTLLYLAEGYGKVIRDSKKNINDYHRVYMQRLWEWMMSAYTHKTVRAVYLYLQSGSLLNDLTEVKAITLDDKGFIADKNPKPFIRFLIAENDSEEPVRSWEDRSLQESWIQYYRSMERPEVLDYLTGRKQRECVSHPKKIRNDGDSAKLFSGADKINFTYRGRFAAKSEAVTIGEESSQKIHSALNWIIRKQGKALDSMTLVVWESSNKDIPSWDDGTADIIGYESQEETDEDTNERLAKRFYSSLYGYENELTVDSKVHLMAFDAATPGRLSFTEYKTMQTVRYLDSIKKWHEECAWMHPNFDNDGKRNYYIGVPGIKKIVEAVYGTEDGKKLKIRDDKLYPFYMKRLLPCIWNGTKIPADIVLSSVERASMPQCYEWYNWERVLCTACSLVKKSRKERKKEEWDVALNKECKDRSYLYGRLLAIADRIEYMTYDKEKDYKRITNAKKYMTAFYQRPYGTWQIIERNIQPYLNKLGYPEKRFMENQLEEVYQLFDEENFQNNKRLEGLYLLGFHSQSFELKRSYKNNENTEE